MSATFFWYEDNGAASGSPAHGTTSASVTNVNWKNIDDTTTAYSAAPITAGNNSYQKNQYGRFTAPFDEILAGTGVGYFAHTAGAFGTDVSLFGVQACTSDGSRYLYVTPSTTTDSNLTTNMTSAITITSGVAFSLNTTGPYSTGMSATTTTSPSWTNYLTTQLQTTVGASPGDTASITLSILYQEN